MVAWSYTLNLSIKFFLCCRRCGNLGGFVFVGVFTGGGDGSDCCSGSDGIEWKLESMSVVDLDVSEFEDASCSCTTVEISSRVILEMFTFFNS